MRRAKILATLGPSSDTQSILELMVSSGLNAVRINMSHGTREEHAARIGAARAAAAKLDTPLAVLVDLCGPKIRTGKLENGKPVELKSGDMLTITTREVTGNSNEVSTNFSHLPDVVEPGTRILVDDGAIELQAESENKTD